MIFGTPTATFILIHVIISLIGIATGFVVLYGLLTNRLFAGWTALFLVFNVLTDLTGYPIPPFGFDPPRVVGTLSLVLLAVAILALYVFHANRAWRWIFIGSAMAALYLNVFVAVIQSFQKISFLNALAPTQSEPPFVVAQVVVLVIIVGLAIAAIRRFHRLHA
jgi:hypothetical protein